MPVPRRVLNGFTAADAHKITGLSRPMLDYLNREGLLRPSYTKSEGRRGYIRYYSYRDLAVARMVQRLRETGVELRKLKAAINRLSSPSTWARTADPAKRLAWLVSDGKEVMLKSEDGFLDTFRADGQRVFTFVVNLDQLESEIKELVPLDRLAKFSMQQRPLVFEKKA
jgi:DNA-binding transcriptional MerR regulator